MADPQAVRQWEHAQRLTEHAKRKLLLKRQGRASAMSGIDLTFPMRVGEQDKLFGSVTNRDIARLGGDGPPGRCSPHRAR